MEEQDNRVRDVVSWMMSEVESGKRLYQERVARHVRRNFGEDLTSRNSNGNWALDERITTQFRAASGERVVWERSDQCWRLRRPGDKPGRMQ